MSWRKLTRAESGYTHAWDKLRVLILKRDRYLCQPCLKATPQRITTAHSVDHIRNKAKGGGDHPSNLQAICKRCHTDKTIRERGFEPRPQIGLNGYPVDPNYKR